MIEAMDEDNKIPEDFSILNLYGKTYDSEETEAFYRDLNLLQVIDRLASRWGNSIRKYFMYLPENPQEEAYRREVYGDVKKDAVYRALISFTEKMEEVRTLCVNKETVFNPMQSAVWKLRETAAYGDAYETLERELSEADLASEGMQEFLEILRKILKDEEYVRVLKQVRKVLREIGGLRFIITYDKDRISVALGEVSGDGAYEEWLDGGTGEPGESLQNPFIADALLTELEVACLGIVRKKKPDVFRELKSVAESYGEFGYEVLRRFEQEVRYYLSYCSLQRNMEQAGYVFATPETDELHRMEAKGLYDMALALVAMSDGRTVIPNDFYYDKGDRFFVLTGPNQGGKTTFSRSLGQLVYLTKMGLDVPAESANVHHFPNIQTHFSIEESVETGRGKLMEELVRLAPMMETHRQGSFVVINELFTTAANYDAQIMGKRVLEHFIGLGCMGIYVTHIKELADDRDGVVSLRAMLNDSGIQTFEIRRGEAEDTACAANQVNKYRLTYEQLKERL